jgi:hypothetical protein
MKHLTTSLIVGACLLVSSAGVVFATDPHKLTGAAPTGQTGTTGQGTGQMPGVASCGGSVTVGGITFTESPPNGTVGSNPNSPFFGGKTYAGAGVGSPTNTHANSQYDNACLQTTVP